MSEVKCVTADLCLFALQGQVVWAKNPGKIPVFK